MNHDLASKRAVYSDEFKRFVVLRLRKNEQRATDLAIELGVNRLRTHCQYVVASCDFEDYIVEQTGWNWTLEKSLPPK